MKKTIEKWKRNDKNSGFWALPPVLNMPFRVIHVYMYVHVILHRIICKYIHMYTVVLLMIP